MEEQTLDLTARLGLKAFSHKETIATIRGEHLAEALGTPLLRICAVRGIRHTPGFAEELYGLDPLFTRAINARKIMSNIIPDMEELDEVIPYCIWYPEVATEETYRQLARRYPSMRYHVARACAVAGYTKLYYELDILPDTHIAEEAREAGSKAIFDSIMAHPVLYSVMDDYTSRISPDTAQPAQLNADTAVVSSLLETQGFHTPDIMPEDEPEMTYVYLFGSDGFDKQVFNITEDESIDIPRVDDDDLPAPDTSWTDLLSSPLPAHLTTMDKDNLILMAAYNGDIDRYVRLKRPVPIPGEWDCCAHGIYHNTGFAVWWHKQGPTNRRICAAVAARYIMNNILLDDLLGQRPYLIFYPTIAEETTYRELARRYPSMLPQVLRACIAADYKDAFVEFLPGLCDIDKGLYKAAARSADVAYKQKLDEVLAGRAPVELSYYSRYKEEDVKSVQSSCNVLRRGMARYLSADGGWPTLYDGASFDTAALELYMCAPKTLLESVNDLEDDHTEYYVDYSTATSG